MSSSKGRGPQGGFDLAPVEMNAGEAGTSEALLDMVCQGNLRAILYISIIATEHLVPDLHFGVKPWGCMEEHAWRSKR